MMIPRIPDRNRHQHGLRPLPVVALLLGVLYLAGCHADTTSTDLVNQEFPPVGQTFVMKTTGSFDSASEPVGTVSLTVQASDVIFQGREGVVMMAGDTVTSALTYESNGDVSLYVPEERFGDVIFPAAWITYPFSGSVREVVDTTLPISGDARYSLVRQLRYVGEERLQVNGSDVQTSKVTAESRIRVKVDTGAVTLVVKEQAVWYSKRFHYVVREDILLTTPGDSTRQLTMRRELQKVFDQ